MKPSGLRHNCRKTSCNTSSAAAGIAKDAKRYRVDNPGVAVEQRRHSLLITLMYQDEESGIVLHRGEMGLLYLRIFVHGTVPQCGTVGQYREATSALHVWDMRAAPLGNFG